MRKSLPFLMKPLLIGRQIWSDSAFYEKSTFLYLEVLQEGIIPHITPAEINSPLYCEHHKTG